MIDSILEQRFRLTERLARQGVVELFAGLDQAEGRPVWVKVWGAPVADDLDWVQDWQAQLKSVQALDDGHLPQILAFGRTPEGALFQVEEPPHGVTLRRFAARRAPMGVAEAVETVAAAARAVGVAHREGVAHGGLNPETIFIEEEGARPDAFVTNWEAGELVGALRRTGEPVPERIARYLAPEQGAETVPPPTMASDVYALGAILYELLTGSLPLVPTERDPVTGRAISEPTPPRRFNPQVPGAVEQVLLRALSRDPATRQPNGQALASALLQALTAPEPVALPPLPVVERQTVVVQRRPLWPALLGFFGLLGLCLLLTLLWQLRQPQAAPVLAAADATATAVAQSVPNLIGPPYLRYNEAVQLGWSRGFVLHIVAFRNDPNLPNGVVLSQCPAAGFQRSNPPPVCRSGSPPPASGVIEVEVSSLPEPVVLRLVPELYGQPEAAARAALEQGGLRVGVRREAYDLLIPAGAIVEQNPRRGLAVLPGTPVDVIVSAGLPPTGSGALPAATSAAPIEPVVTEETASLPLATATLPPEPRPSPSPTSASSSGVTVLFSDDFEEGNGAGWVEDESGQIEDGVFRIAVEEPELLWISQPSPAFDDFAYGATVTLDPNTVDREGGAGLVFRIEDSTHFYFFEINIEGQYRLRARDGDRWEEMLPWTTHPELIGPGTPNRLRAEAVGERLTLFINDAQAGTTDVPPEQSFLAGGIGIGATSGDVPPLIAEVDDVRVTRVAGSGRE